MGEGGRIGMWGEDGRVGIHAVLDKKGVAAPAQGHLKECRDGEAMPKLCSENKINIVNWTMTNCRGGNQGKVKS